MSSETHSDQTFSNELRLRTKNAHDASDRLINLKLAVVLTDTKLWSTALAEFYFIFGEIERAVDSCRHHPKLKSLAGVVDDALRTPLFERDLHFYLGNDWRTSIKPSNCAIEYCERIAHVAKEEPILLIAYVHSMYLALLAGGQIMKKIVKRTLGISGDGGLEVFSFASVDRSELRQRIKTIIDNLDLSSDEKESIISEKIHIFQMNNKIAGNIGLQVTWSSYQRLIRFTVFAVVFILACRLLIWYKYNSNST